MKALKLAICALALGVMASTPLLRAEGEKAPPAENQNGKQREPRAGRGAGMLNPAERIAAIDEAVGLTGDQKTKIKDIFAKAQKDVQALPQEERREKGAEILRSTREDVRAVLTDDQKKKFDEMPKPGRGGRRGGLGGLRGRGKKN